MGTIGGPRVPFVQVPYHGHTLYYRAAEDLLLWERAPNTYQRVSDAPMLAALAATPPTGGGETARLPKGAPMPPAAPLPDMDLDLDLARDAEAWAADVLAARV